VDNCTAFLFSLALIEVDPPLLIEIDPVPRRVGTALMARSTAVMTREVGSRERAARMRADRCRRLI
jgi:hypothetical protein